MSEWKEAYSTLREYRHLLTRQQVKTLAGQIKHGKPNEAMNGLAKILNRREYVEAAKRNQCRAV